MARPRSSRRAASTLVAAWPWHPLALILGILVVAGCSQHDGNWSGPQALSTSSSDAWQYKGEPGLKLNTRHYTIYTTIADEEVRTMLPQVMEGAYAQYARLVGPGIALSERPMDCYVFRRREEWNDYTRTSTGRDASVYLQIRRGGYAIQDRYVAYFIGVNGTASVAAHEGWHQFVARNFKGRLPPFLEEGLATTFEGVEFNGSIPRWNPSINALRAQALKRTIEEKHLWPTEQLIRLHAGEVVNQSGERIEAFYAQCWAFAKFLREAEGAKYAPALHRWLAETADGTVFDPSHSHSRAGLPWNPGAVKPMVEHYLGAPLPQIDAEFQAYMRRVIHEEYPMQWHLDSWTGG